MEAEDVLQESFITIYESIHQLKNKNAFEGWMKRIVVNNSLKYLKKQKYDSDINEIKEKISEEKPSENYDIKERILNSEISQEEMLSAINTLPTGFKTVFNLYVFEKLKHSEISQKLNISVGTSKSQLLRARALIQKNLHNLVSSKEKERKPEYVMLTAFFGVMEDDLKYIDQLAHDKLNKWIAQPKLDINTITSAGKSVSWVSKAKLAIKAGSKTFWYVVSGTTTSIIAVVWATVVFSNNSAQINPISSEPKKEILIPIKDTITKENETTIDSTIPAKPVIKTEKMKPIIPSKKETKTVNKKVYVKKVVKIKKRKIVNDTLRKTDTLHLQ